MLMPFNLDALIDAPVERVAEKLRPGLNGPREPQRRRDLHPGQHEEPQPPSDGDGDPEQCVTS